MFRDYGMGYRGWGIGNGNVSEGVNNFNEYTNLRCYAITKIRGYGVTNLRFYELTKLRSFETS
jgi:hypothetical protein